MKTIGIIGAGRLGTSLGLALRRKGIPIAAISDHSAEAARESCGWIDDKRTLITNVEGTAAAADIIFLTVPDDSLNSVVSQLRSARLSWKGKTVFHCSGMRASTLLRPLQIRGARTASFHPIQSFAKKDADPESFSGITFGLEGDAEALDQARSLIKILGGQVIVLDPKDKPLYHAACSMASNLFAALVGLAVDLLKENGMESEAAFSALLPLIQGTLKNMSDSGPRQSLTGPLKRGDIDTVAGHLKALEANPIAARVYRQLSLQALEWIRSEKTLNPEQTTSLENLLEEK